MVPSSSAVISMIIAVLLLSLLSCVLEVESSSSYSTLRSTYITLPTLTSKKNLLSSNRGPLTPASLQSNGPSPMIISRVNHHPPSSISTPPKSTNTTNTTKIMLCLDCVDFMNKNLNTLVAVVTKIGETATCDKICSMLNNSADVEACNLTCNAIGSATFWHMFVSADINPVYACEMVNACFVGSPAANITKYEVAPQFGPPGTTFEITFQFTITNETGVGEYAFVIYYPTETDHKIGFISQQLYADYIPGDYTAALSFPTNNSFNKGTYLLIFDLCSGACGQVPDPYPYAQMEIAFNITNN